MSRLPVGGWGRVVVGLALLCTASQAVDAQEDTGQSMAQWEARIAADPGRLDLVVALGNAAVWDGSAESESRWTWPVYLQLAFPGPSGR